MSTATLMLAVLAAPAAAQDQRVWSRVSAFGQVKFTASISDIAGSHTSVTGGVRVREW